MSGSLHQGLCVAEPCRSSVLPGLMDTLPEKPYWVSNPVKQVSLLSFNYTISLFALWFLRKVLTHPQPWSVTSLNPINDSTEIFLSQAPASSSSLPARPVSTTAIPLGQADYACFPRHLLKGSGTHITYLRIAPLMLSLHASTVQWPMPTRNVSFLPSLRLLTTLFIPNVAVWLLCALTSC